MERINSTGEFYTLLERGETCRMGLVRVRLGAVASSAERQLCGEGSQQRVFNDEVENRLSRFYV